MTEPEIRKWMRLGITVDDLNLHPNIVEALKDTPVPVTDEDHVNAVKIWRKAYESIPKVPGLQ